MPKLMVISDTHLGVKRQTGTTQETQAELSINLLRDFRALLHIANRDGHDLLINGDLFDGFEVSKSVEFDVFKLLFKWVTESGHRLILSAGNHDLNRCSDVKSSFQNLCSYLTSVSPDRVQVIDGAWSLDRIHSVAIIPHLPNQEEFDAAMEEVLAKPDHFYVVCVHANYDNFFARESDHSLNVSAEMAKRFEDASIKMVFGHEHKKRQIGNVHIVGNQLITSVADCLNDDTKQYILIDQGEIEYHTFTTVSDVYAEVDWRETEMPNVDFVRVTGTAEYSEAADVVSKLAKWRKESPAFVITNAVKVGQMEIEIEQQDLKHESFDIQSMVLGQLPEILKSKFEELINA